MVTAPLLVFISVFFLAGAAPEGYNNPEVDAAACPHGGVVRLIACGDENQE